MSNLSYVFIDESGDPGKPYELDEKGNKIPTGASLYYILTALPLRSESLFALENEILNIKHKFGFKKEIKSTDVSLSLYKDLLKIINSQNLKIYYRCVDKTTYKGKFAVDGNRKLHNVFDEYNLTKLVKFTAMKENFIDSEVIIDRADRRLLDGKFDNCNNYLMKTVNSKTIKRVGYVTHVSSEYVTVMQFTDLIGGAIKEHFTARNKELKLIIDKKLLIKIY